MGLESIEQVAARGNNSERVDARRREAAAGLLTSTATQMAALVPRRLRACCSRGARARATSARGRRSYAGAAASPGEEEEKEPIEMADVANLLLAAQNRHMYGSQRRTAIVVGGGVSGLSTGWYLKKLRGEGVE